MREPYLKAQCIQFCLLVFHLNEMHECQSKPANLVIQVTSETTFYFLSKLLGVAIFVVEVSLSPLLCPSTISLPGKIATTSKFVNVNLLMLTHVPKLQFLSLFLGSF